MTITPKEFAQNLCANLKVSPLSFKYQLQHLTPEIYELRDRVITAVHQLELSNQSLSPEYVEIITRLDSYRYSLYMECPYVIACIERIKLNTLNEIL